MMNPLAAPCCPQYQDSPVFRTQARTAPCEPSRATQGVQWQPFNNDNELLSLIFSCCHPLPDTKLTRKRTRLPRLYAAGFSFLAARNRKLFQ